MAAPPVAIVMGSDSDLSVMREAAVILDELRVGHAVDIVSAHRTPEKLYAFAKSAKAIGVKVVIAGAGGAAHLPGMIAALTTLPVIGVPVRTSSLDGMDSLLSIVQMPPGVPVATVAINGARNAGLLAAQILALADPALADRVAAYKQGLERMVLEKAERLANAGHDEPSPSAQ